MVPADAACGDLADVVSGSYISKMVWDLRGALLKKEETESARLADFEFRLRARTMRLLAGLVDPEADPADFVRWIAEADDAEILAALDARYPALAGAALRVLFGEAQADARASLIAERGNPAPHRLA